jgi:NTP pyrophosphatase (non-canonical NTP hydrolase)
MCVFADECVFDVIFSVEKLKNDIENAFDSVMHIQTAYSKRKSYRPLSNDL